MSEEVKNNDKEYVNSLLSWQYLFQDIHPLVEKELICLAMVIFQDAESCTINVQLEPQNDKLFGTVKIDIALHKGFKGLYNKYIKQYNKNHTEWGNKLIKCVDFWMPCNKHGHRPRIELYIT